MIYGVIEYALNLGHHVCLTYKEKNWLSELAKENSKTIF